MSEATDFEVDGVKFKLEPLKLKQQMKGEALVLGAVLPAMYALGRGAENVTAADIGDMLKGFDRLPDLFDIFVGKSKVEWQGKGYVELAGFADNVFERRGDLLVAYVAECVAIEYACFLAERGRNVVSKALEKFASLMG